MDPVVPPDWPVAGHDYPADWAQFQAWFPDEAACLRYLERLSWPHGFLCPACGDDRPPWRGSRQRLVCRACGHQTTVTAGTLFQGTRTPLRQWFAAAWMVATAEQGVSARQLAKALNLGSYETAWTMLHRFRRAMVRSGRPRLEGRVELGTIRALGRPDPGGPAAATAAIAVEDRGAVAGRIRMQRLPSAARGALVAFAGRVIEPGTLVRAVRLDAWWPLAQLGFMTERAPRLHHLPAVEEALAAWLRGTHHGATSPAQLDWYLDEFTFRFNRRGSTHRGLLFYRLLEESVVTPPLPYSEVVGAATGRSAPGATEAAPGAAPGATPGAAPGAVPGAASEGAAGVAPEVAPGR